ncbi:hypothetical protein VTJ04DRAFT_10954 [Mycothermus thermophilus]
MDNKAHN